MFSGIRARNIVTNFSKRLIFLGWKTMYCFIISSWICNPCCGSYPRRMFLSPLILQRVRSYPEHLAMQWVQGKPWFPPLIYMRKNSSLTVGAFLCLLMDQAQWAKPLPICFLRILLAILSGSRLINIAGPWCGRKSLVIT